MNFFDRAQKRLREFLAQNRDESADSVPAQPAVPKNAPNLAADRGQVTDSDDLEQLIDPLTIDVIGDLCAESPFPVISSSLRETTVYVNDMELEISLSEGSKWLLIRTFFPITQENSPFAVTGEPLTEEQVDTQLHLLIDATNAWNQDWYQPTAYVDRQKDAWFIRLDSAYFAGAGLTADQFLSILIRTASFTDQARDEIPSLIPPV